MDQAGVMADTPERYYLSGVEIGAAFAALSPSDKLKLGVIDDMMRGGTGLGKGDLVQEAILRALDGSRNCPRDVSLMAFLVKSMQSIAGHERTKQRRLVSLTDVAETIDASVVDPAAAARSPEDDLVEKQSAAAVQAIYAAFSDDPEAQLVLMGWTEELRGAALREATGLDQGQLDYAIRRIRARMRKLYPEGVLT